MRRRRSQRRKHLAGVRTVVRLTNAANGVLAANFLHDGLRHGADLGRFVVHHTTAVVRDR